jgi:hypothetical protein
MRHRYSTLIVTAGVLATLAAGGGLAAWAGWSAEGRGTTTTARSGRVPVVDPPRAEISGSTPKISWNAVRLSAAISVDRYVLIRIDGSTRAEVCKTAARSCRDSDAPAGSTLTYVVHATAGSRWAGEDSKPSNAVVRPDSKKAPTSSEVLSAAVPPSEAVTQRSAKTSPAPDKSSSGNADSTAGPAGSNAVPSEESTPTESAEPSAWPHPSGSDGADSVPGAAPTTAGAAKQ